jgi:hypothetical protein
MDAGSPAPPDTKAVVSGTVLKGRWKLVQKIGQGAFGEIFSGHDQTTLDPIAVKLERWDSKKAVLKMEVAISITSVAPLRGARVGRLVTSATCLCGFQPRITKARSELCAPAGRGAEKAPTLPVRVPLRPLRCAPVRLRKRPSGPAPRAEGQLTGCAARGAARRAL